MSTEQIWCAVPHYSLYRVCNQVGHRTSGQLYYGRERQPASPQTPKLLELKRYSPHSLGSVNLECMGRCVKKKEKGREGKQEGTGNQKMGGDMKMEMKGGIR